MRIFFRIFLWAYALSAYNLYGDNVVAVVNGYKITQNDVNAFVVKSIPGGTFKGLSPSQQKSVINQMVERRLFWEDAKRIHIEKNPNFIIALNKLKENLMLDFWMKQKVEEIPVSDEAAKRYYNQNIEKFRRQASVKVRHILLTTEPEALATIEELTRSNNLREKFIELAKTRSTGPSSIRGGELDWFIHDEMVSEFSDAAFALEVGEITPNPVQTQFGYHVIYLESRKSAGYIPFAEVKAKIVKSLRLAQFKTKLYHLGEKLKQKAKIIVK
jgi:hypothetical protein